MQAHDRKVFRELMSLEDANSIFWAAYKPSDPPIDKLGISDVLGRILAEDVFSEVDVPSFDRASMDGFAVKAEDTFGVSEQNPFTLRVLGEVEAGNAAANSISKGETFEIATGAPIPRGSDAVVMVEYTKRAAQSVQIYKSVTPGENVTGAGSDIMTGELILRKYQAVTPREIGLLAAAGIGEVQVYRKPQVSIFSSGNELIKPGEPFSFGRIYDTNGPAIAASVAECGGEPHFLGILPDDYSEVKRQVNDALKGADIVISSGSTSSGPGDLFYRVVDDLGEPGVLVHGLTIKPGKPALLGVVHGKPVFGLPGYPTSALMIFHVMVAPIIRRLANLVESRPDEVSAFVPLKFFKARGRRELLPVQLLTRPNGDYIAYPMQSGSGAISSFSLADGFVDLPTTQEYVEEGERVTVRLFGRTLSPPTIVAVGSHCVGVDILFSLLKRNDPAFLGRTINVGSIGGFRAVKRGETDLAGVHIQDESTGEFNLPFISRFSLEKAAVLVRGYDREQGLIIKEGNPKRIERIDDIVRDDVLFINRNKGSGTRLLIDKHLTKLAASRRMNLAELSKQIHGYGYEAKTHSAVAAAVKNDRADVGFGIRTVAEVPGLKFIKLDDEKFDFLIPLERVNKKSVVSFLDMLKSIEFSDTLRQRAPGLTTNAESGAIVFEP